jgi:hypothetical protein
MPRSPDPARQRQMRAAFPHLYGLPRKQLATFRTSVFKAER